MTTVPTVTFEANGQYRAGYVDDLVAKVIQLQDQVDKQKKEIAAWRDVIAVFCRDGGHYHQEHGTEATKDYVLKRYYGLLTKIDKIQLSTLLIIAKE